MTAHGHCRTMIPVVRVSDESKLQCAKPQSGTGHCAGTSLKAYCKDQWWKAQISELYLNVLCFGWSLTNVYALSNHVCAGNGKKLSSWAIILVQNQERARNTHQENSLFNRSHQNKRCLIMLIFTKDPRRSKQNLATAEEIHYSEHSS